MPQPDVYDFSNCLANVFGVSETQPILKKFPHIFVAPIFHAPLKKLLMNQVLRYIVAVYDSNGLITRIPDVVKRRQKALEISGFKRTKEGTYPEEVMAMIEGKNEAVNEMILQYLKLHRSPKYSVLMALDNAFYTLIAKTLSGVSIEKKEVDAMRVMEKELSERTIEFLGGDDNKKMLEKVYQWLAEDSLGITPEDVAFKRQQGLKVTDVTPYGEDYEVETYPREE